MLDNSLTSSELRSPAAEYVVLTVADDGCGMDPQVVQKLFDPFFSTKFSGRGLGMSTVLGIVRGHHGAIQVSTAIGAGSTFRVLIPALAKQVSCGHQANTSMADWSGYGHILLADDEASVCKSIELLLRTIGFKITTATNGREAVELFASNPDSFDLAILDMTMPIMDGVEASKQIHAIRAGTPIILMSGFNQEFSPQSDCHTPAFLQKPFRIDELKRLLAKSLATQTCDLINSSGEVPDL